MEKANGVCQWSMRKQIKYKLKYKFHIHMYNQHSINIICISFVETSSAQGSSRVTGQHKKTQMQSHVSLRGQHIITGWPHHHTQHHRAIAMFLNGSSLTRLTLKYDHVLTFVNICLNQSFNFGFCDVWGSEVEVDDAWL